MQKGGAEVPICSGKCIREGLCFSYGADNQGVWHEMWFLRARRRACKHSVFNFLLGLLLGIATCGISPAFRARKQLWSWSCLLLGRKGTEGQQPLALLMLPWYLLGLKRLGIQEEHNMLCCLQRPAVLQCRTPISFSWYFCLFSGALTIFSSN